MKDNSGAGLQWRTARLRVRDALRLITPLMFFYIAAQFACWTVHDAIQEWMFKQARNVESNYACMLPRPWSWTVTRISRSAAAPLRMSFLFC